MMIFVFFYMAMLLWCDAGGRTAADPFCELSSTRRVSRGGGIDVGDRPQGRSGSIAWAHIRPAAGRPPGQPPPSIPGVPMLVAFSVAPSGGDAPDASVHDAVAAAVAVVRASGLPNRTDSMFTTIEGDWDEVFDVVRRATEAVAPFGTRVSLVLKADIRPGYAGELTGKLERLESALEARDAGA